MKSFIEIIRGKRMVLLAMFGAMIAMSSASADVVVRFGPPRPVYERHYAPPRPGYEWVGGYHRWDGRAYVWSPGYWAAPPRHGARWVPAHWTHYRDGYRFRQGFWR